VAQRCEKVLPFWQAFSPEVAGRELFSKPQRRTWGVAQHDSRISGKGFGQTERRGGRGRLMPKQWGTPSMSGMLARRNKKRPRAPNRHRRTSNVHIFRSHTARTLQVLSTRAWDPNPTGQTAFDEGSTGIVRQSIQDRAWPGIVPRWIFPLAPKGGLKEETSENGSPTLAATLPSSCV